MTKRAFTFPGQGSQAVGMGKDLAATYQEARNVFAEVDEALGQKLSAIMFEGPDETLKLTENAQPALMAVSVAVTRVLASRGYALRTMPPSSPGIRWASTRRWPRPKRFRLAMRRGC